MSISVESYIKIRDECNRSGARLIAVSKTKPAADIKALYDLGQRDFGENYVQELVEKQQQLPADIRWHFIGHLQSNKVKYIAPFVHLIHGVDSLKLLREINKQAVKINRVIQVLLQVHIASEETKFGLDSEELAAILQPEILAELSSIHIAGLMGMASFSENQQLVEKEFRYLKSLYDYHAQQTIPNANFQVLSMGMSGDYALALACGSNMLRVGSLLFGSRQ